MCGKNQYLNIWLKTIKNQSVSKPHQVVPISGPFFMRIFDFLFPQGNEAFLDLQSQNGRALSAQILAA
jgi:hypothetical protein